MTARPVNTGSYRLVRLDTGGSHGLKFVPRKGGAGSLRWVQDIYQELRDATLDRCYLTLVEVPADAGRVYPGDQASFCAT